MSIIEETPDRINRIQALIDRIPKYNDGHGNITDQASAELMTRVYKALTVVEAFTQAGILVLAAGLLIEIEKDLLANLPPIPVEA